MKIQSEYKKAFNLIEKWRYRYDVSKAVQLFVAQWAYECTGLYQPTEREVQEDEFIEVAKPLSHILANLMYSGVSDPLAFILSEFCKGDAKHQGYYPTPPEVGYLISKLLQSDQDIPHKDASFSKPGNLKIYEPCCGSAGIIMEKLEQVFYQNIELDEPLGHVELTVEDISSTALHAFCIQVIFKIKYLSLVSGKKAEPFQIDINQIDVLRRSQGRTRYLFTR
ncbi:TPA: N-6 DNA methylase [Vibrio parahaemolyticus]|nr:N-6 DNA methylase [Vibrio alginolyticus]HCG6133653.1 N-6 DNA methylase [Vibrio parahaemolyticus]